MAVDPAVVGEIETVTDVTVLAEAGEAATSGRATPARIATNGSQRRRRLRPNGDAKNDSTLPRRAGTATSLSESPCTGPSVTGFTNERCERDELLALTVNFVTRTRPLDK